MTDVTKKSFIAILIVLLVAVGIAFAGSQGSVQTFFGLPLFAICVALAFLIQWIAFIPAFAMKTEKFFDLTGGLTYITVVIFAVFLSPEANARSIILLIIISIWAARLGTFLFRRIQSAGEDRRFREIKKSFARFLMTWTIQGLWVTFSLAAALVAITSSTRVEIGVYAWVGLIVWLFGFGIEVIADQQKSKFKAMPENKDKFINVGLWSWSRHPNYFGEIVLWLGVAIIALPTLSGWGWLMLISPVFVFLLLTRISGIPILEARAEEKWGGQANYETYKAQTSSLIPMPPTNKIN